MMFLQEMCNNSGIDKPLNKLYIGKFFFVPKNNFFSRFLFCSQKKMKQNYLDQY